MATLIVATAIVAGLAGVASLVPETHGFTVVTMAGVTGLAVISVGLWGRTRRPDTYLCAVSDVGTDIGVAL